MNLRLVADVAANTLGGGDSAAAKIFGTEAVVSAYGMLQEVLGAKGLLRPGTPGAVLEGAGREPGSTRPEQHLRRWNQRSDA